MMKDSLTELVFILDKSGSMSPLADDTIGGFNSMLEKQRDEKGEAFVSTVLFDSDSHVLHDRIPIGTVPAMTKKDCTPYGSTALIDVIGGAIHHIGNIHKYIRPEDVPAHTLFIIITDGMENASHQYSSDTVKKMISSRTEEGWEFLFLGANIDAVETAQSIGIRKDRSVDYLNDKAGTVLNYEVLSKSVSSMRTTGHINADWSAPIQKDYQKRSSDNKKGSLFGRTKKGRS